MAFLTFEQIYKDGKPNLDKEVVHHLNKLAHLVIKRYFGHFNEDQREDAAQIAILRAVTIIKNNEFKVNYEQKEENVKITKSTYSNIRGFMFAHMLYAIRNSIRNKREDATEHDDIVRYSAQESGFQEVDSTSKQPEIVEARDLTPLEFSQNFDRNNFIEHANSHGFEVSTELKDKNKTTNPLKTRKQKMKQDEFLALLMWQQHKKLEVS